MGRGLRIGKRVDKALGVGMGQVGAGQQGGKGVGTACDNVSVSPPFPCPIASACTRIQRGGGGG